MARELKVEIVGDSSSLQRALGQATDHTSKFGSTFARIGKAAAVAGAAMAAGVTAGVFKAIGAASDLGEQLSKTQIVFGKSGNEVEQWSKNLSQSFGLSQRAALEAAGTYGNMLVPMGFARDEAAGMSRKFVELAADMASFNNAAPEETLDALRAGLAGETEPLRRFGVFLNDARIKSQAAAMGFELVKGQLDPMAKAAATAAIIMKDTADTQGDFGRTSDSLANQQRILRAQLENTGASLGRIFLPAMTKVLQFVNMHLIPGLTNAISSVKDFFAGISEKFAKAPDLRSKIHVIFEGATDAAGQFVDGILSKIESLLPQKPIVFKPAIDDRGLVATGGGVDWLAVAEDMLGALSVALKESTTLAKSLAATMTETIRKIDWVSAGRAMGPGLVAAFAAAITTALDPAFWVKNWDLALAIASVAFSGPLGKLAASLAGKLAPALVGVLARVSPAFAAAFGRLIDDAARIGAAAFGRLGEYLSTVLASVFGRLAGIATFTLKVFGITAAINAIADFVTAVGAKIGEVTGSITSAGASAVSAAVALGQRIISGVIGGIAGGAQALAAAVAGVIGGAFTAAFNVAHTVVSAAVAGITPLVNSIASVIRAVVNIIAGIFTGDWPRIWQNMKRVVEDAIRFIVTLIGALPATVLRLALEVGTAIVRGIGQGLQLLGKIILDQLQKIPAALHAVAGQVPGIAKAIGLAIIAGVVSGLAGLLSAVVRGLATIQGAISNVAASAAGWATHIGSEIVSGILGGLGGLYGALKSKLEGALHSALSSLNPFSPVSEGGKKYIGVPIVEGAVAGVQEKSSELAAAAAKAVKDAVAKAQQAVKDSRGAFSTAFGDLASNALSAFDAVTSAWKAPASVQLDKLRAREQLTKLKDDIAAGVQGVADANAGLTKALSGGDPEEIARAQQAVTTAEAQQMAARRALRDHDLEIQAQNQQAAHDKQRARQRAHFDEELQDLQNALAKHPEQYKKVQGEVDSVLQQAGINSKFWGSAVGIALAQGLSDSKDAVRAAAHELARVIARLLKTKSPAEEGPMSDLNTWWATLGETLAGGIKVEPAIQAGIGLARALLSGASEAVGAGVSLSGIFGGITPKDAEPAVEAVGAMTASLTTATGGINTFGAAIEALPIRASTALTALVTLTIKTLAKMPELLKPSQDAFAAVAEAIGQIGNAAYYARAALQDTADDIARLVGKIAATGFPLPGRALGGPVTGGSAYVVGERGPELFVPGVSGSIVSNANMGGGGGTTMVFNFPNYIGSKDELVQTVREGFLRIDRYNTSVLG